MAPAQPGRTSTKDWLTSWWAIVRLCTCWLCLCRFSLMRPVKTPGFNFLALTYHTRKKIAVTLQPCDTDNFSMSNTLVKFRVLLHYEDGLMLNRTYTTNGIDTNSVLLPLGSVAFSGQYTVTVKLEDGWDDEHYAPGRCRLNRTARFNVSCEYGYEPDAATKKCSQIDFGQVCKQARVALSGSGYLSGRPPSAGPSATLVGLIGPDGDLHVAVDQQSGIERRGSCANRREDPCAI